jgi:ribosomal protein S18 acetylase RimI-like enzyme
MAKIAETVITMKDETREITYLQSGAEGLDMAAPLWHKLIAHHKERSIHFKDYLDSITWDSRKKGLLEKAANGALQVDLAKDKDTIVGICISSVNQNKLGELESIYVEKEYRGYDIGDKLMKTALAWMDRRGVVHKVIGVGAGNEEVFGFYRKYGFYPRGTILMQLDQKKG